MWTAWTTRVLAVLSDVERPRETDRTRPDMETDMSGIWLGVYTDSVDFGWDIYDLLCIYNISFNRYLSPFDSFNMPEIVFIASIW